MTQRPAEKPADSLGDESLTLLLDSETLAARVAELGSAISLDYAGRTPLLVVVMHGALVFAADLMRNIRCHVEVACVTLSSYPESSERMPEPRFLSGTNLDARGRDVIVIEDIVDTGHTLAALLGHLQRLAPASLAVAVCLDKPSRRELEVPLDYVGFQVPPLFVVGYGLDYGGRYRNLPYVAALNEPA